MTKHKTDDYKNSAVKYYLNNENGHKTQLIILTHEIELYLSLL